MGAGGAVVEVGLSVVAVALTYLDELKDLVD